MSSTFQPIKLKENKKANASALREEPEGLDKKANFIHPSSEPPLLVTLSLHPWLPSLLLLRLAPMLSPFPLSKENDCFFISFFLYIEVCEIVLVVREG